MLVGLDELEDDDQVMIMTGVGAPGTQRQLTWPRDGLRALELACEAWEGHGAIVGTMTAHPGAFMAGTWLANALDPNLAVIDCNANGRGHPTVAMGGMGLASRTDIDVVQAAVGGVEDHHGHIEIVASGPDRHRLETCSTTPRRRPAARCSPRAGRSRSTSCASTAPSGAVSACIRLGEAMIAAEGEGGEAMIAAITRHARRPRARARAAALPPNVAVRENWDVGTLEIDSGSRLVVHVCNEYMAADIDGERVATYPDLIVTLAESDGMPTPAAHREPGERIVVLAVPRDRIPLGAGVREASVYRDPERLLGIELVAHAGAS